MIDSDVGRPAADFAKNVADRRLLPDAELVLEKLTPIEDEVQDNEGRWYLRRIAPYRTEDDRINGVVVTFVDVHQRKLQEAAIKELAENLETRVAARTAELQVLNAALQSSEAHFRGLLEAAPDAMIVTNGDGEILRVNEQTEVMFGCDRSELEGQPIDLLIPERLREAYREQHSAYVSDPTARPVKMETNLMTQRFDGAEMPIEIHLSPVEIDGAIMVITAIRDKRENESR
jgi:PAS domain S-box-containing protein